jgi:hypothetical protein
VEPANAQKIGLVRIAQKWVSDNAAKARINVRRVVGGTPADPETDAELVRIWNASKPKKLMLRILSDIYGPGHGNALIRKVRDQTSKKVLSLEPLDMRKCVRDERTRTWSMNGSGLVRENLVWFTVGSRAADWHAGENQWIGFEDDLRTLREESAYTADVLTNCGVIGLIISKDDQTSMFSPHAIKKMQQDGKAMTTRGNRGSVLVSGTGLKATEIGEGPERLSLDKLPVGAQSRVAANLGVAMMVLGMPDPNKTYSNLAEATKGSLRSAVVSFHDLIAEVLAEDLLNDVGMTKDEYEIFWDYSDIEEFQNDVDKLHARVREDVKAGLLTPNEGRAKTGEEQSDDPTADSLRSATPSQEPVRP